MRSSFPRHKLWGLITYQPRWGLTLKGLLVIVFCSIISTIFIVVSLHPFLAPRAPINAEALVIEGWISDKGIQGAIAEFEGKNYRVLMTVGNPIARGYYLSGYQNFAELSAATAKKLGFKETIVTIASPDVDRDRTLASAVTVKKWLQTNHPEIKAINLYSQDVHGRRSWLLYKKAFQSDLQVGIISQPPSSYNPQSWWRSSEGFRMVIGELIAYIYAKFFS